MHQKSGREKTCKEGLRLTRRQNLGYRKFWSQDAQPSPAGAAAWRVLSAGGHRAERLESEILMARQPLGQYELSCRGPGVQRYLARRPSVWRWRWRTKGGGEVEGRASDGTGGWARTPAKWWRCSPPPCRGPAHLYLYRGRPPADTPAYVSARSSHQRHRSSFHRRSSSSSCRSQLSSNRAGQDVVADVRRRAPHVRD